MKQVTVKEKILNTASDLFYRNGYNLTGINEIIEKAGVAKASLYKHFPSKDDLAVAYLKGMHKIFLSDFKAFLQQLPEGKERILGVFDFLLAFYHQDHFRGCWCLNILSEIPKESEKIQKEITIEKDHFLRFITSIVAEHSGEDEEKVARLGRKIYLLYEGAIAESQLQKEAWPIEEAREMAKLILV